MTVEDRWVPVTREIVVATKSAKRYWDDLATRKPAKYEGDPRHLRASNSDTQSRNDDGADRYPMPGGAPLLDYWKLDDFTPTFGGVTMGHARFIVADVFDGLAQLDDGSVDLVITSPPFLALRSYLPADHPDKEKEIGSEATPAEFIDVMLAVTAELRRVLAPHGSLCVELGDTYCAAKGYGKEGSNPLYGERADERWREAKPVRWSKSEGDGWPLAKSKTLIPQLYEIALAYGFNPLTGQASPAGKWRIRNVVTWARPNPPVGALGDKWRPATSDVVVACTSNKRYWDDLATRTAPKAKPQRFLSESGYGRGDGRPYQDGARPLELEPTNRTAWGGAPLLDYWEIPPTGYSGAHYAVYPFALVEPLIKAMCPQKVCRECGEPSRRIVETEYVRNPDGGTTGMRRDLREPDGRDDYSSLTGYETRSRVDTTTGFTDCGHDNYRPGLVLDPFAGTGTTLMVATGHGHNAIGIDLDERNAELAMERVGPFLLDIEV